MNISTMFSGGIGRGQFFSSIMVMGILVGIIQASRSSINSWVYVIILLPFIILATSIWIKRIHDLNRSGWWSLINFLPFVNILFFLYLTFMPGDKNKNKYGIKPAIFFF